VPISNGSTVPGEHGSVTSDEKSVDSFTLRDLYVRASISGNSLAAELGRYLNIDENTFSSSSKESSQSQDSIDSASIHEKALAAILEVVISNSTTSIEFVRVPEPQGGVKEWWAQMLSGSLNNSESPTRVPR
jgi:hypothetical protein